MTSTNRPIECLFVASGIEPRDLAGKRILSAGAGKTHWGLELTKKYGQVARTFDNLDLKHGLKTGLRGLVGKIFLGEVSGNNHNLPYQDKLFDYVLSFFTIDDPVEYYRVIKPGGTVVIYPSNGDYSTYLQRLQSKLPDAILVARTIDQNDVDKYLRQDLRLVEQEELRSMIETQAICITKPVSG